MRRRMEILVAAVVLFAGASPVMAVIEFKDGLTHDINYQIDDHVLVDDRSPGMGTTVNILEEGSITPNHVLAGYEDSIINIVGGPIHELHVFDSTRVTVSGGAMYSLQIFDTCRVTVSGGAISANLSANGSSQVAVSGGSIDGGLYVFDSTRVTVSGGQIGRDIFAGWDTGDDNQITFLGWRFTVDGVPFGYGELTSIYGGTPYDEPARRLRGILVSGELLDNDFYIGGNASIVLVPEPATLLFLGLGGAAFLRKRRQI
jgi:hypothetical protein